jgi:MoaA/NifB/PqqE/SkfB family radical SAM enzyme
MSIVQRMARHARLSWQNLAIPRAPTPPFFILFINSICNLTCEHCFYWRNLNRRDDLTVEEIFALADELDRIENLNLSGGEPFIRKEFAEICRHFIQNNGVEQIYVPTNAYFTDKTVAAISDVLQEPGLKLFAAEISLDGMAEFHNRFRGSDRSFEKAMETYAALAELQKQDARLRIHSISTVTSDNMDEIRRLTTYLYDRCPAMDHHNIALIRGDRKNPSLQGPDLLRYQDMARYVSRLWTSRESGRFGHIVEPMLQWAKVRTAEEQRQVVPCRAGVLSGVVYANGDVSVCETHPPLGNLRQKRFKEIWYSAEAEALRQAIQQKACYCTNEVFLWPSIAFQPAQLAKAMWHAKVWEKPEQLSPEEKLRVLPVVEQG